MASGTSAESPFPASTRCDRTAAWAALAGHFEAHGRDFDLREAFARDPGRFASMSIEAPEVFADLSKNLLDTATLRFLADLARETGVLAQRDAMLAGAAINERNLPIVLGLVDVRYRNFHRFASRCVAPYSQALQRLPAFLQQLEMKSNGKRVDRDGAALPFATIPVVWGEPGTNAKRAYFQMLHQGSDVIPVDFVLLQPSSAPAGAAAPEDIERQHRMLLANGLAQGQALMRGRASASEPHRDFPGNRPSTTLVLERLAPRSLGALIALYEHRVFASEAVRGIDSFDQWGVELGKMLGNALLPALALGAALPPALDASTLGLIRRLAG